MKKKKAKPQQQENNEQDRMPLAEALRVLKERKPWAPVTSLRRQITLGKIPAVRSGNSPRARYFVLLSDLEAALPLVGAQS